MSEVPEIATVMTFIVGLGTLFAGGWNEIRGLFVLGLVLLVLSVFVGVAYADWATPPRKDKIDKAAELTREVSRG